MSMLLICEPRHLLNSSREGRVFRLAKHTAKIAVSSSSRFYLVNTKKINEIAGCVLSALGLAEFDLSIQFVEAPTIKALNKKFRGKDKSTDVLSFPQREWPKPVVFRKRRAAPKNGQRGLSDPLGDVVISLANAKKNAKDIGHDLDRETAFLLVHGILHLCGHDHMCKEEEELMTAQQRKLMQLLARPNPHTRETATDAKRTLSLPPLWKNCVVNRKQRA